MLKCPGMRCGSSPCMKHADEKDASLTFFLQTRLVLWEGWPQDYFLTSC